jgi:hypothetical protein
VKAALQNPDGTPLSFVVELPVPAASIEAWAAQTGAAIDAELEPQPEPAAAEQPALGMELVGQALVPALADEEHTPVPKPCNPVCPVIQPGWRRP